MTMKSIESEGKNTSLKMVETEELNRIKGHFMKKYGVSMDKFSAIVLQEMKDGFEKVDAEMMKNIAKIDEASQKIKGLVKHISFQNSKVAFWYAMGKNIPIALATICLGFLLYSAFIFDKKHANEKPENLTKTDQNSPKHTKNNQKKPKLTKHDKN
jgi:hypothetical protein